MAKSARSSSRKRNNANLRKVMNPLYEARTERLSAKLRELAAAPKPETEKAMEIDSEEKNQAQNESVSDQSADNSTHQISKLSSKSSKSKNNTNRVSKRAVKKRNKNSVVFTSDVARKKRQTAKSKKS